MKLPSAHWVLAALALGFSATLKAQAPAAKAQLSGRVIDGRTGAGVAGAPVTMQGPGLASRENSETSARSAADGTYSFTVPAGSYDVSVQAADARGNHDFAAEDGALAAGYLKVTLAPGEHAVRDFSLKPEAKSAAYRVEAVALPRQMVPETAGVSFTPRGSLVVLTRRGDVWIRDSASSKWRRFATGLNPDAFGVYAVSDREVVVSQRPELTRLVDTTGAGVADTFETLADDWGMTGNYHEFTYGVVRDRAGNFYGGLGLASREGDGFKTVLTRGPLLKDSKDLIFPKESRDPHRPVVRYEGWVYQVTKAGEFVPFASGFRQTLGVGMSPRDELFVTDVAGTWVPTSELIHVEKGHFYGNPESLRWDPNYQGKTLTLDEVHKLSTPPAVYIPHGALGTAVGQPVWDTTGGKFGPFAGQIFLPEWEGSIDRVDLELVAGEYQGAAFLFLHGQGLRPGDVRAAFSPDGGLYVGQTLRGWGSTVNEGIQRIAWTGVNPVEIKTIRLTPQGFTLLFTEPMGAGELAAVRNYRVQRFQYNHNEADGSLQINQVDVPITAVRAHPDGLGVDLDLLELLPDFVYQFDLDGIHSRGGAPLGNPLGFYTANNLLPAFAGGQ